MTTLIIENKEYKIKFGYNCFCDTDLLDRVEEIGKMFSEHNVNDDSDVKAMGMIKDLFVLVRELLFVGFKKYNPVDSLEDVGNLLDTYKEEEPEDASEEDKRGLFQLFMFLGEELMNEGFLSDLMNKLTMEAQKAPKVPQDRKRKSK